MLEKKVFDQGMTPTDETKTETSRSQGKKKGRSPRFRTVENAGVGKKGFQDGKVKRKPGPIVRKGELKFPTCTFDLSHEKKGKKPQD